MSQYFVDRSTIFENEQVLEEEYTPEDLPERETQLEEIGETLSSAFNGGTPNNLFLYGKAGQGKTASARMIADDFEALAEEKGADFTTIFQTCSGHKSSYQIVCSLVEYLTGEDPNGLRARKAYDMFYDALDSVGGTVTIILDEIDNINDDTLLYELPRARDNGHIEEAQVSVIGISNDSSFQDNLSPKVKDSLNEEEINFPPYEADQLRPILRRRVEKAFVDGVVNDATIRLCAAYAAQDKGSARQAIRYLYRAGDLAANNDDDRVTEEHAREAEEIVDRKNITESIRHLTVQDHLALVAVTALESEGENPARTRQVYSVYKNLAREIDADAIAMRRVRDHLQELDMIGIISGAKKAGGSRGGKHWYWELSTDLGTTIDVLDDVDRLDDAMSTIV